MEYSALLQLYKDRFNSEPRVFRSPGRINIIGEHTDYNDGFVLPAGIDKEICMVMGVNFSDTFNLYSVDKKECVSFTIDTYKEVSAGWAKYIIGVIDQLVQMEIAIGGFDCVFQGDIPLGAGLSSSAALECATLYGLKHLFNVELSKKEIALIAQKAENQYVGVNCGIMDQFASVFAAEGQALKLDCRDLSYELYPLEMQGYQLVLVDSLVSHNLASSEYNVRRAECEEALAILQQKHPHFLALRDASIEDLEAQKDEFRTVVYKRAKYMIEEIARVGKACQAMTSNDLPELGSLLYATHAGLQHEFEISCKELDFLVDFTRDKEEILGSRMMGGGFGGCTINLVKDDFVEDFELSVSKAYEAAYGKAPAIYRVKTSSGSSEITASLLING
ncbi:galactokinase [Roseivirga pacifica]|uniref:galactokinase n=1 Tax=Roseivirga pacifica TaxID=1267423 RepID=UPI003BB04AA5